MEEILEGEVEFDNGIVPTGMLGNFNNFAANGFFEEVVDADSAKKQVNNMERLKKLMEAAEQYGQYASEYCEAECKLFFKISEIDGAEDKLSAAKRRLVSWLRGKTISERKAILEQCKDGTRVHIVFKRETRIARATYDITKDCDRISLEIESEAERYGRVTLTRSTFYERAKQPDKLTPDVVSAYVEHTRDKLLRKRVLGLGDGSGTYVSPEKCDRNEVAKMVEARLKSIVSDLKAIKDICLETGFVIPRDGVEIIRDIALQLTTSD